jgi:hypothetical protein
MTTHSNGVGQNFFDFSPLNTYTSITATEACTAYAASVGGTAANCSSEWVCPIGPANNSVCYGNTAGTTCTAYCWEYQGTPGMVESCSACATSVGTWH